MQKTNVSSSLFTVIILKLKRMIVAKKVVNFESGGGRLAVDSRLLFYYIYIKNTSPFENMKTMNHVHINEKVSNPNKSGVTHFMPVTTYDNDIGNIV